METNAIKPNPEIQTAKDLYIWLWTSPLFTIPTLLLLLTVFSVSGYLAENNLWLGAAAAALGSALWHLLLLIPVMNSKSEFVRWHGRQALLLALLRTATAFWISITILQGNDQFLLGFIVLVLLWLFGNLWGQGQASHGECSLMRWTGHGDALPLLAGLPASPAEPPKQPPTPVEIDQLVGIIRFNTDPEQRHAALAELERLGLVEAL